MRCSARRRRAAATISIARVIFWMFATEEMRLRTSRCDWGMVWGAFPHRRSRRSRGRGLGRGLGGGLLCLGLLQRARGLGDRRRLLIERVAFLVEVVAEVRREGADRAVHLLLHVIGPLAGGDALAELAVLGVDAFGQ